MRHHTAACRVIRSSAAIACGLAALTVACSGREVNLGDGLITRPAVSASRCSESASISADIRVANQNELDELTGCEEIDGSLRIEPFADADLSPLRSLRVVSEAFELGTPPITADPDEHLDASGRYQELIQSVWLATLGDLASLSRVGTMVLSGGIDIEDLTELTSLRSLTSLTVTDMRQLRSLRGLEQVTLTDIWVGQCEVLESLEGPHLAPFSDSAHFEDLPALKNADVISDMEAVGELAFQRTGIEALPDLSALWTIRDTSLEGNLLLADVSGLSGLQGASRIELAGNPLLRTLPDLSKLYSLDVLQVRYNDSLEELVLNFPALTPERDLIDQRESQFSATFVDIGYNGVLRHISSPASFTAIQYFSVSRNPSLTDLDLGTLQRADFLQIRDNAELASVSLPSLATVDSLEVTNNPSLAPSAFDSVQTFSRTLSGNATPSTP